MFRLSAFADEISPDPQEQVAVLRRCGIRHLEFRSILKTNVPAPPHPQVTEFKPLPNQEGIALRPLASPIGKVRIEEPFAPRLDRLDRALELAKRFGTPNVRIFSYSPAEGESEA